MPSKTEVRLVMSPEGVALPFELAPPSERAVALLLDLLLLHGLLLLLAGVAIGLTGLGLGGHGAALFLLASFVLRNAYFSFCEIAWGGKTPGKHAFHLRVVSRDGGALSAEAVIARNLTRDFEVFLPFLSLFAPGALLPGLPGWAALLGLGWLLAGGLLPLFNRDHLRLGDMLGGTLVVRAPRVTLLPDVADAAPAPAAATGAAGPRGHVFTLEQLDLYGIEQLQVLERLLRAAETENNGPVLRGVGERIRTKIGWSEWVPESRELEFLQDFYRQQRARLEHKALFGVRQERKREGRLAPAVLAAAKPAKPAQPAEPAGPATRPEPETPAATPEGGHAREPDAS
ncbi:MAG: RDD family protein [Candidatus Eisenbacteria bacterium]|uniref:RDD family protein n=1 Tax=Eiseniibacteriota bacterium TaxID=2212470 RepID=A0A933SHZ8_UNCEI|nr:RDD family protein [Candidatus Eisenbacteria bacterium]